MDVRSDMGKADEVILPGFRFHPTEEELVGFYLKRKIQQKPLSIELIRELNIYKYDPWDLPKLAMTGEKEWYFYCPRDRKYRNSARPNRVTGAGFWKATGTDRPIYSSHGTKCIGLKKSLVFYKGRSAKGVKTDWMMHEFRLPSPAPNDSWAICRIFRKTISLARRAQSHSWLSPMSETTELNMYTASQQGTRFSSENIPCTSDTSTVIHFGCANSLQHKATSLDVTSYKPVILINSMPSPLPVSSTADDMPDSFMFSPVDMSMSSKGSDDIASLRLDLSETVLGDVEKASASLDFSHTQQSSTFTVDFPLEINGNFVNEEEDTSIKDTMNLWNVSNNNQWGSVSSISFPFDLALTPLDEWKPSLPWDLPAALSEMPVIYPTNLCHARVSL